MYGGKERERESIPGESDLHTTLPDTVGVCDRIKSLLFFALKLIEFSLNPQGLKTVRWRFYFRFKSTYFQFYDMIGLIRDWTTNHTFDKFCGRKYKFSEWMRAKFVCVEFWSLITFFFLITFHFQDSHCLLYLSNFHRGNRKFLGHFKRHFGSKETPPRWRDDSRIYFKF